ALGEFGISVLAQEVFFRTLVGPGRHEGDDGISENSEVRTAVGAVDGVGCVGFAGIEVGGDGGGEVAAGGEAHDPDVVRSDAPFGGANTQGANGALCVANLDGMVVAGAE